MKRWFRNLCPNLFLAGKHWVRDEASSHAAAVAYYLALSLFPLILLLISGFGLFLTYSNLGQDAEAEFLVTVGEYTSPAIQRQFAEVIGELRNQSVISGPFGLLMAVFTAMGVFAQFDRGFDKIWKIESPPDSGWLNSVLRILKDRSIAFVMLIFLGACVVTLFCFNIVLSQIISAADSNIPGFSQASYYLEQLATIGINSLLFGMVYKWLPRASVSWLHAWRGGLVTAVVWELGRIVLGVFLIGMRYTTAYGAVGSFIAILLWCYYGVSIVFFGAEYVQIIQSRSESNGGKRGRESTNESEATSKHGEKSVGREESVHKTRPRRLSRTDSDENLADG